MVKQTMLVLLACVLLACGPDLTWEARYPDRPVTPVRDAVRVRTVESWCDYLGRIVAVGRPGELIEPIADLAARHGGDRYIVRGVVDERTYSTHSTTLLVPARWSTLAISTSRTSVDVERTMTVFVYRCQ